MAALTNEAIDNLLELLLLNNNWANVGDATGLRNSSAAGSFYLSLHTSSPGASGNQTTNETSYGSYARVAVARSGAGWVRTGEVINPAATISFPACTSGTATITHAGLGTASSGSGHLIGFGAVTPNISVSTGITPQLTTASSITAS